MAEASEPPSYQRAPAGSMLDPLEPVIRKLTDDGPEIHSPRVTEILRDEHGYEGSIDLLRKADPEAATALIEPPHQARLWPARSFGTLAELDRQYADWRERCALPRQHASGHFIVAERLAVERETARPLTPAPFDYAGRRSSRVPLDGYLKHRGSFYRAPQALVHQRVELRFDRDRVWTSHRGATLATYERSYEPGVWQPAPRMRPEPPPPTQRAPVEAPEITPPVLADYAELCA